MKITCQVKNRGGSFAVYRVVLVLNKDNQLCKQYWRKKGGGEEGGGGAYNLSKPHPSSGA